MPEPGTPQELRARAARLRSLARTVDTTAVLDLYQRAGTDVWIGPTPDRCLHALLQLRSSVLGAADQFRDAARQLESRAEQLAQVPSGVPG